MLRPEIPRLLKHVPATDSGMTRMQLKRMYCFFMVLFSTHVFGAGNMLTPNDSNSRLVVENAIVKGEETTIFFYTHPDRGDPNAGKPCALNYYSVTLKPDLPSANADVVAKGVCGGLMQKSRLLDSGDALIIIRDRLERWRAGEQITSRTFSSIDAVGKLGVTTDMMGGQFYDISPNGDIALLIRSGDHTYDRNEYRGSSMVMSGLKPDGERRWEERFSGDPTLTTVDQIWVAPGGSALLYFSSMANGLSDEASQLQFISANGTISRFELNKVGTAFNFDTFSDPPQNLSHEEMLKQIARQNNSDSTSDSIEKLAAVARADGGFDVLFHREGGEEGREGYFLYRISSEGTLNSEISLGNPIMDHGLERWVDFYLEGNLLVLLSSAAVTQKIVRKVKRKWAQNIVSWIDLSTGIPTARMIPLDEKYLEAALNSGDEGQQYLEGQPGSEPALLTTLGGKPLVVSVGWISHRQVLRLNEADVQLMAYTEAYDEKQARLAKEASRRQRKTEREARKKRMQVAEAEAAGMTLEEYNALSKAEQKKALVNNGGFDKLMATMTQESQDWQAKQGARQGVPGQPSATPQDMNDQIAAALAQAQEQMDNDPDMTPAMRAQMSAMMAQMGQSPDGQNTQVPGFPVAQSQPAPAVNNSGSTPAPENVVLLDSNLQGFLEFDNEDGRTMTLLIFNRQSGDELFKKEYPDGVIYEYVNFSRFNLPLQHIGVMYRDVTGLVLKDLTPAVNQ
jgi:hypothetical protein